MNLPPKEEDESSDDVSLVSGDLDGNDSSRDSPDPTKKKKRKRSRKKSSLSKTSSSMNIGFVHGKTVTKGHSKHN